MSGMKMTFMDEIIHQFDMGLKAITGTLNTSSRYSPAKEMEDKILSQEDRQKSCGLMRVNHTGEVCAQALYLGQSLVARQQSVKAELMHSALEELDHLHWCEKRVQELGSHVSYLNPVWFAGSFMLGLGAGLAGDKWSLGFLAATEYQVEAHLSYHLQKLPEQDLKSRKIVEVMREDELKHAKIAEKNGAEDLPKPIKCAMKLVSKVMTSTAYYI